MITLLLAIPTMYSLYLVSLGKRMGWLIGAFIQIPWAVYSIATAQWGFLLMSVVYLVINVLGWRHHGGQ